MRGATHHHLRRTGQRQISIHAPLAGCDTSKTDRKASRSISIHAPLAGCDLCRSLEAVCSAYFNPRTPCGVRRHIVLRCRDVGHFNPRTPCGVRRCPCPLPLSHVIFQSTHPLRGATRSWNSERLALRFQSTHPLRGATFVCSINRSKTSYFNPRTPCGVRQPVDSLFYPVYLHFNPRTPCGVRLEKPP